jgi:coproporphyrinogen III oxidase-like Fe-S oxidoreductase
MMNQLRLHSRFSIKHFQTSTGLSIKTVLTQLELAKKKELMDDEIIANDEYWHVTKKGQRYLNDLLELFL